MSDSLFFAARPFAYGPALASGDTLDVGEIVSLGGYRNDQKLIDYGHLRRVETRSTVCQCGKCGRKFANEFFRNMHGEKRHGRVLDPAAAEAAAEAEDRRLEASMPLHLNKSAAEVTTKRGPGRPRKDRVSA